MHTTSALGSAAADFASLLEAVALDPEALLGKAALSRNRAKVHARTVQTQKRQSAASGTAVVDSLTSQASPQAVSPGIPASGRGLAETELLEVQLRRNAQKSNRSSQSLSQRQNLERRKSPEVDLHAPRPIRKTASNQPLMRASRITTVASSSEERTIGSSSAASRGNRSTESARDMHAHREQAQQIVVVRKQMRGIDNKESIGSKTQRKGSKGDEIRQEVDEVAIPQRDRKPPRSLRLRANVADQWHAIASEAGAAGPGVRDEEAMPAALAEALLADDTVAIGHPGYPVASPTPVPESVPLRVSQYAEPVAVGRSRTFPRRKCVTISVRLNEAEAEMLRCRASESELSVSDYLRSCVLEADQLRLQVKQVLAEMRTRAQETAAQKESLAATDVPTQPPTPEPRWKRWLAAMRSPAHAVPVAAIRS